MSDTKLLRSARVRRWERQAGNGFDVVALKPANDNRPAHSETRASLFLGRGLMLSAAVCIVVVLLAWLGWTGGLLLKALMLLAG